VLGQSPFRMMFNKLMPWDHAPGWLLRQEAGGFSAQFDGSLYRPTVLARAALLEFWGSFGQ
jgi:fructose-1,6-bisphosphatase/inositol monophosphatase family enzyme